MKIKFSCGEIDFIAPAASYNEDNIKKDQSAFSIDSVSDSNQTPGLYDDNDKQLVLQYIKEKFNSSDRDSDSFFVCDIDDVDRKFRQWKQMLPRVKPFYAVKCNPDPIIIRYLALQGSVGFDCASKAEIEQVMAAGISASNIIFANPCKFTKHIEAACRVGVKRSTFDSVTELVKIAQHWPDAELVLRVLPKVFRAQCPLGLKFGALEEEVPGLLGKARELGLNVIGVSFHVGSGCLEVDAWSDSIHFARHIFDLAARDYNYKFHLLDVGGGFPGNCTLPNALSFSAICARLNSVLDECFPAHDDLYEIIAEPGRYFVAAAFTLATQVHCTRTVHFVNDSCCSSSCDDNKDEPQTIEGFHYYISDGLYGSFNNIMFDHAVVEPLLFRENGKAIPLDEEKLPCKVFGPTCDSADIILDQVSLPRLRVSDWLVWPDMGAYTHAAASSFNGMSKPEIYYIRQLSQESMEAQQVELNSCQMKEKQESMVQDPTESNCQHTLVDYVCDAGNLIQDVITSYQPLKMFFLP